MTKNQNPLFSYLEKEHIAIDKSEFIFQFQSHPDFPSLLAISDTLHFFSVENGALAVEFSEIDLLPDRFIAILKENTLSQSFYIERREERFFYTSGNKPVEISKTELETRWQGIILLVEKSDVVVEKPVQKANSILYTVLILAFLVGLFVMKADFQSKLFIVFPLIGLLFSIATLKDLLGTKSKLLNDFCNITASTSCTSVIGSEKWKLFKYINFSDLSTVFFATQFAGTFLFLFSGNAEHFYFIQQVLLLGSIPVIFISLYFQKFVEKKWCPICLAIMVVIIAEIIYLRVTMPGSAVSITSMAVFAFLFLFISAVWSAFKKNLLKLKELKEFQFRANRFIRNYEIFKNILVSNQKNELAHSPIILGNRDSSTEIAIITNPFCGYCKEAHEILDEILHRYHDKIKIKILINADFDNIGENEKKVYRSLMSIYLDKGERAFLEALSNWFSNPNLEEWLKNHNYRIFDTEKIDAFYSVQHQWCIENNAFHTPSLYINGYRYPKSYDRNNLKYFVDEIIEDANFN